MIDQKTVILYQSETLRPNNTEIFTNQNIVNIKYHDLDDPIISKIVTLNPNLIFLIKYADEHDYVDKKYILSLKNVISSSIVILNFVLESNTISEISVHFSNSYCYKDYLIFKKLVNFFSVKDDTFKYHIPLNTIAMLDELYFDKILTEFNLTPTEKEIVKLKRLNLTRKEIAKKRVVSEDTIRNHISNILKKLDCVNTKEALCKISKLMNERFRNKQI
ncbi:helix-turn-helix transcriptional regulator [Clostridiaceae bacterium M8S5]|nr:helix-turn-helix transcriptional regulator [Clostridiaceae bacterium M8S5]